MTVRTGETCTILGCSKPMFGRTWCGMHYATWRTYGDPQHPVKRRKRQGTECAAESCDAKPKHHGYCHKHAKRLEQYGELTEPRERKFWAKVNKDGPLSKPPCDGPCWLWTGAFHLKTGYGVFGGKQAGTQLVHRISYLYLVGPIPEGLVLDHLCHTHDPDCADNEKCPHRRCVNPAHLEPVTMRENIARGQGGKSWGYVPDPLPVKPNVEKPTACTGCGGEKPIYKRTLCRPCYRRWLRDPTVERPSLRTPEQRFWSKVKKSPHCWLWTAYINPSTGYGQFGPQHGVSVGAHRYAYELVYGPIPDGYDVHHKCMTRRCVNPDHLEAVTRAENLLKRADRR